MTDNNRRNRPVRKELKTTKIFVVGTSKYPEDLSEIHFDAVDANQSAREQGMKAFQARIYVQHELKK